ncbi:MAG: PAS domain-containing protein, partial [Acidobacteriota bacterium]
LMADAAPLLIWVAGPDSQCTFLNKYWLAFTGRSMEQELGYGWLENLHPDDRGYCLDTYRAAFQARRDFFMEYRLRRASGEYAWIADTGTARFAEDGGFAGYIGTGLDVSERRLKEQELKESEETLKALMDVMPVGVRWSDYSGAVEYVNRSFVDLFGYTLEEIPTLEDWFSKAYPDPVYREAIRSRWGDALDESNVGFGPTGQKESDVTCKDGSVRHVIVSTRFAGNRKLVIFIDVTERDTLLDRLLNTQRLESLGVLAGRIAHDFNNVLTGIMGNISLARLFIDDHEKLDQLLDHGEQASRRAAELVGQLLTFAKGGAPIKKPVSVRRLVQDSVASALHGTQVEAVMQLPDSIHDIEADTGQLSQVFHHIIVNAVHAMQGAGVLTVRAGNVPLPEKNVFALPAGEYLTLDFADEGCGMPDQILKRIFDPYFTTKPNAAGIGLASSHSIIKKHGGHIDVRSTVGKGTTFTLYLPSLGFSLGELGSGTEGGAGGPRGGGAILVMDDEWLVRDIAREMLEHLGYQVTTCGSGEEAVALYRAAMDAGAPFTAAIMDLTVPCSMGGQEAARQILRIDSSACLIVSSGYSNDPVMADYASHGFRATLAKPYQFAELEQVLSSLAEPCRG